MKGCEVAGVRRCEGAENRRYSCAEQWLSSKQGVRVRGCWGRIHGNPCRGRLGRGSNEFGRGSNELGRGRNELGRGIKGRSHTISEV